MIKLHEVIQDYETHKISLEDLQDYIWGLSENTLEMLSSNQIAKYLLGKK